MSDKPSRFYKVWILFMRHKLYRPLPRLKSHLTVFRDIIKGQQVANPMLHGMVLPLLLSGKVTNQNNNQNITKPTTPNR